MSYRSFIALGSNIEPRESFLAEAIEMLANDPTVAVNGTSKVYQTAPVGYTNQASFLNMVVEVETTRTPEDLLTLTQSIEMDVGREKTFRNGPRQIDLDILWYEGTYVDTAELTVPHPRMTERAFVLIPLHDLAPYIKVNDQRVEELVNRLDYHERAGVEYYAEHVTKMDNPDY
ncbi:2-amino-4-hydroxy-6-hydroxymethyldihydropteridine diphosphokinase [Alkalibacillus flavidus]|uniref:2-amino-4-hydroxy-6-hydroxymethyldihydropteridine diphosphokinase n=1 Tax=Alkalibacillus flavidus TaxID=546021 RepID=A0ABV2KWJ9_9BACI